MIKKLLIQNYAIIEYLEIDFSQGLTIITGETGAGKSILLGALGLVMGNRAETKVLYNESEKCVVEGIFNLKPYDLKKFFEANDLDFEEETVIRREITPAGKTRAFVNDTPVNLKVLQDLSSTLIDLHQQFDTLDINSVSFQLRMLDALAGNKNLLNDYQKAFRQYEAGRRQLEVWMEESERSAREQDFLAFQMEEFNQTGVIEGEQESQEEELSRLNNAEDIKQTFGAAYGHLVENELSLIGRLKDISVSIGAMRKIGPSYQSLYERLESTIAELQDLAGEFETVAETTELNQERALEIQQRLDQIYRLQKKHGVNDIAGLLRIQEEIQQQLESYSDLSGKIAALEQSLKDQEKNLQHTARELSKRRKEVIPAFTEKVEGMLSQLSMEHARLEIQMQDMPALSATGLDDVSFLFAANKGSRLQAIKDVASGGELSRLALCTKSLVASAIPLPTMVFDEIDAGVSGDVSLKMGDILRKLSNQHQVVVITHSPQVAAKADVHYFVYKKIKDDRTVTGVRALSMDERVRALATMLSSNPPSESAIANARELLQWAPA
mgnify:CR=1 FL=1